jgi:hypothetical protein
MDLPEKAGAKRTPYDISKDFGVLASGERQGILKTAKALEKIQAETLALLALADVPPAPPMEAGKQGKA